jgi:phosphohistidine phosphatase
MGDYLRTQGITVDTVLCSSAARARQTLDLIELGEQLDPTHVEIADRFYHAGADTLINAVRELPDDCRVALLIGHAPPGAPGPVHVMTDPATSTQETVGAIESRFPAAALAQLEFDGAWSCIDTGSLVPVRTPGHPSVDSHSPSHPRKPGRDHLARHAESDRLITLR